MSFVYWVFEDTYCFSFPHNSGFVGISEDSDAVAIVVSEETGLISFVRRGRIKRGLEPTRLRAAIYKAVEQPPAPRKAMIDPHATESTEVEGVT